MTLEHRSRDKKAVDPDTGKWPHAVRKAARISDLIAALEQIKTDEGDIEIVVRRQVLTSYDSWSETEPVWDVSDLTDVVANPHITEAHGLVQDGKPLADVIPNVHGRFLMLDEI